MRVDVEDAQPSVEPALLRDQGRAYGRVVAPQHNWQRACRRLFNFRGDGVNIRTHIAVDEGEVAIVLDGNRVEQLGVLTDRREDGGQLSQLRRRPGGTGTVERTALHGHPQDSNIGPAPRRRCLETAPGLKSGGIEVELAHALRNAEMTSTCAAIKVGVHPWPAD